MHTHFLYSFHYSSHCQCLFPFLPILLLESKSDCNNISEERAPQKAKRFIKGGEINITNPLKKGVTSLSLRIYPHKKKK